MKTKNSIFLLFIIFLIAIGCNKSAENNDIFTVSGYLQSNGVALENITVDIDGLEQYKTTSSANGYFKIENVSGGAHELNTKNQYGNGSFIQKSYDIVVNTDLVFDELLLPNPVSIISIELDSANNIAIIKWNKSYAEDFREYKLYSHPSTGLDETTGTLEHVTTNANDTTIDIELLNNTTTYFRVFVLNDYGQLGGSNIEPITSINTNLLKGANFENNELFYANWTLSPGTSIDIIDSISYEGNQCIYMQNVLTPDPFYWEESHINTPVQFEKDREYKLSFWYRLKGIAKMDDHTLFFNYFQNDEYHLETSLSFELGSDFWSGEWIPNGPFKILDDTGWLYYSKTFISISDSQARFYIGGKTENIMLDKIEIRINE